MNKVRELAEYTSNRLAEIYEECNINNMRWFVHKMFIKSIKFFKKYSFFA